MRAAASRGLFGASLGGLSYLVYKQAELQELIQAEENRFLRSLQLDAKAVSKQGQKAFEGCMQRYGACVLLETVPLHQAKLHQPKGGHFAEVLEGITFQGRPLLGPSKSINLDVAGAAIGSALAITLSRILYGRCSAGTFIRLHPVDAAIHETTKCQGTAGDCMLQDFRYRSAEFVPNDYLIDPLQH